VSNRYGVGATVRLESALGVQSPACPGPRIHVQQRAHASFRPWRDTVIRRMVVTWPERHSQDVEPRRGQRYLVTEPSSPISLPATPPGPRASFRRRAGRRDPRPSPGRTPSTRPTCSRSFPPASTRGDRASPWDVLRQRPRRRRHWRHDPGSAAHSPPLLFGILHPWDSSAIRPTRRSTTALLLFDSTGNARGLLVTKGGNASSCRLPGIRAQAVP